MTPPEKLEVCPQNIGTGKLIFHTCAKKKITGTFSRSEMDYMWLFRIRLDLHSIWAWIWIRIRIPDPGV
jgi:hypothetical protein